MGDSFKTFNWIWFKKDLIIIDANKLGDRFIQDFDINCLKDYFTNDGWGAVINVYDIKIDLSTCKTCKKLCFNDCIQCSKCLYWFHFICVNLGVDLDSTIAHYEDTYIYKCFLCENI